MQRTLPPPPARSLAMQRRSIASAAGPSTARQRSSGMSPRSGGPPSWSRCRYALRILLPQLPPLRAA
eukprot:658651-Lingulodinium_polyedra.AAC.1